MKILNIKKEIKPYEPEHKKYIMYSAWATIEHNEKEVNCKIACFVKDVIKQGAEISENDYEIKIENKEYHGDKYIQYTLKKKKKEWNNNKFQKETYTLEEFELVMNRAITYAENNSKKIDINIIFERYINNGLMYGIKINKEEPKKDVPFPDISEKKDVPFNPDNIDTTNMSQEEKEFFKE